MAYEKNKSENYSALGGINTKVSQYITEKNEFLTLTNLDFRTLGSLTSVPGVSSVVALAGSTVILNGLADFYSFQSTFGYGSATYQLMATDQNKMYNVTLNGISATNVFPYLFNNNQNQMSFVKADSLYAANQYDFFAFPALSATFVTYAYVNPIGATEIFGDTRFIKDMTKARQYSLPRPNWNSNLTAFTGLSNANGLSGLLTLAAAFVRDDGFIGPASYATTMLANQFTNIYFNIPTLSTFNGTTNSQIGFTSFHINGMYLWSNDRGLEPNKRQNGLAITVPTANVTYLLSSNPPGGYVSDDTQPELYIGSFLYGITENYGEAAVTTAFPTNPSCNEIYSNQLFSAGFFAEPDMVIYSMIGEYEKHDPEGNFLVRANDGDIIRALKAYFTQLLIFKLNSIASLSGDDPDNFVLTEVTDQYGCISPNGACIWEQKLWFLDKKGICEYNGANTAIVSNKVQTFFEQMNITTAQKTACMIHVKEQNQVWCAIPVGTNQIFNNYLIIYDYLADAWTTRTMSLSSTVAQFTRGANKSLQYTGSLIGNISLINSTLPVGFDGPTLVMKSRYIGEMGQSVEKLYRRLYVNAEEVAFNISATSTLAFDVNLYANNSSQPIYSGSMVFTPGQPQARLDFGVSAKNLAVELIYTGGNFLRIDGFTLEYRFQRAV